MGYEVSVAARQQTGPEATYTPEWSGLLLSYAHDSNAAQGHIGVSLPLKRTRALTGFSSVRTRADKTAAKPSVLSGLEQLRVELMALQQLVELGAVALGETRSLRDVAFGDLQQSREILALEFLA